MIGAWVCYFLIRQKTPQKNQNPKYKDKLLKFGGKSLGQTTKLVQIPYLREETFD